MTDGGKGVPGKGIARVEGESIGEVNTDATTFSASWLRVVVSTRSLQHEVVLSAPVREDGACRR